MTLIRAYHQTKMEWCKVVTYSKEIPEHEEKLMKLWNFLRPQEQLEERITKKWIDIGF